MEKLLPRKSLSVTTFFEHIHRICLLFQTPYGYFILLGETAWENINTDFIWVSNLHGPSNSSYRCMSNAIVKFWSHDAFKSFFHFHENPKIVQRLVSVSRYWKYTLNKYVMSFKMKWFISEKIKGLALKSCCHSFTKIMDVFKYWQTTAALRLD